ncbi:MAG: hypothetical protein HY960_06325 [Ignavibacteriae bacterium]|nr:hypothetical protein [Ignavibacteriota bacterium]
MNQVYGSSPQGNSDNARLVKLMHSRSVLHHLIYSMEHDATYRDEQVKIASLKVELSTLDRILRQPTLGAEKRNKETEH